MKQPFIHGCLGFQAHLLNGDQFRSGIKSTDFFQESMQQDTKTKLMYLPQSLSRSRLAKNMVPKIMTKVPFANEKHQRLDIIIFYHGKSADSNDLKKKT